MLFWTVVMISFSLFGGYYYVQAVKNAMNKKVWLFAGCLLGPMLLPMFAISKQIKLRETIGFNNVYVSI